jgi:hypothetical protein
MTRFAIVAAIGLGGCCSLPWYHCPKESHSCDSNYTPIDAAPEPVIDAATDGGVPPDAIPRPPEPGSCVASFENGGNCGGDSDEPNGSMVLAHYLGTCSAGFGATAGGTDIDVYRTGDCDFGTVAAPELRPWAQISNSDPGDLTLCIFPTCAKGATNVYACVESDVGAASNAGVDAPGDLWTNDVGFRGCCRAGPGRITAKVQCPRWSPKIDTYIWIQGQSCHSYTLGFQTSQ